MNKNELYYYNPNSDFCQEKKIFYQAKNSETQITAE